MPISFTAAERLAITRRQLRIELENAGFQQSSDSFNSQQANLLQVDGSNQKFYDSYDLICKAYELEGRQITGQVADVYSNGDITAAAQTPTIPPFFPTSPIPPYIRNIPLIQDGAFTNNKVKGWFHPTSTDSRYEQNILSNASLTQGLTQMINLLLNGISYGPATTTTMAPLFNIPGGTITNHKIDVTSLVGFNIGDLIYLNDTGVSGLYKITNKDLVNLYIDSVIPSATGFTSAGATLKNTVPGFTNTERQNMTSTNYQELLTSISTIITALILEWQGKVDAQIAIVNPDERSPQQSENTTAVSSATSTKAIISTWQARSLTGVNGQFSDNGINPISAEITARTAFLSTRLGQINTALGGSSGAALSQAGDAYNSSSPTNPYYLRYKWLNFRINRASGSLRRYYAANQAKGAVDQLKADNNSIKAEYNAYFVTKPMTFNDGSIIVHVKDLTGLNNGDTVTIVSETQPEITRTIVQLMGTTQIKLSAPVPTSYEVGDMARVFKTL